MRKGRVPRRRGGSRRRAGRMGWVRTKLLSKISKEMPQIVVGGAVVTSLTSVPRQEFAMSVNHVKEEEERRAALFLDR